MHDPFFSLVSPFYWMYRGLLSAIITIVYNGAFCFSFYHDLDASLAICWSYFAPVLDHMDASKFVIAYVIGFICMFLLTTSKKIPHLVHGLGDFVCHATLLV